MGIARAKVARNTAMSLQMLTERNSLTYQVLLNNCICSTLHFSCMRPKFISYY